MNRNRTMFLSVLIVAMLVGATPALAKGKPGHAGGGKTSNEWVRLDEVSPSFADTVTFSVSRDDSWVRLACYKGGVKVYEQTHGMWDGYLWDAVYTLRSFSWTSGSADCVAELGSWAKNGRFRVVASTSFWVAP